MPQISRKTSSCLCGGCGTYASPLRQHVPGSCVSHGTERLTSCGAIAGASRAHRRCRSRASVHCLLRSHWQMLPNARPCVTLWQRCLLSNETPSSWPFSGTDHQEIAGCLHAPGAIKARIRGLYRRCDSSCRRARQLRPIGTSKTVVLLDSVTGMEVRAIWGST